MNKMFDGSKSQFLSDLCQLIQFDEEAKARIKAYFRKYIKEPESLISLIIQEIDKHEQLETLIN